MLSTVAPALRQFDFARDTFAFRNELNWQYIIDEKTGRVTTRKNDPPPTYALRCFVVVRRARQFFFHAQFDPDHAPLTAPAYRERIREVIRRNCTMRSADAERVQFPGYSCLREFSAVHEQLLKEECGGAWRSYVNSRHWRMLVPFTRAFRHHEANRIASVIENLPILHVVRFPQLTINHAVLAFGAERTARGIDFEVYDPNLPEAPSTISFSERDGQFTMERNIYWAGGMVNVYETYR
jgi:hypothetical protein